MQKPHEITQQQKDEEVPQEQAEVRPGYSDQQYQRPQYAGEELRRWIEQQQSGHSL